MVVLMSLFVIIDLILNLSLMNFPFLKLSKGDKNWHVAYVVFIVCFEC